MINYYLLKYIHNNLWEIAVFVGLFYDYPVSHRLRLVYVLDTVTCNEQHLSVSWLPSVEQLLYFVLASGHLLFKCSTVPQGKSTGLLGVKLVSLWMSLLPSSIWVFTVYGVSDSDFGQWHLLTFCIVHFHVTHTVCRYREFFYCFL